MSLPVADLRAAVKTALGANCTYTVTDVATPDLVNFILIESIRCSEDSGQDFEAFDCYVTLWIVTKFQKTGNRDKGDAEATLVQSAMRPDVLSGITVSGWSLASAWLDNLDEDMTSDPDGKSHRIAMNYFLKYAK